MLPDRLPYSLELPAALGELIRQAAEEMIRQSVRAYRISRRGRRHGGTLRPGPQTPLWNELRRQLRPYLTNYGDQARLGRLLGLPRQRVQAYVTRGSEMPDAERTLQLLAWLLARRKGSTPG